MKKIIEDENTEGLENLLGETITVFCCRYFYTGKLIGIDNEIIKLENPSIVYETGDFTKTEWEDSQSLNCKYWYIQKQSIESFGVLKIID